ncbi:hypothetical protein ABK040_009847 [Willaertia magna]
MEEETKEKDEEKEEMIYGVLKANNKDEYILDKKEIILGRDSECDIVLPSSKTISLKHAKLKFKKGYQGTINCIIEDLSSENGTLVNDKRLFKENNVLTKHLRNGDLLRFGFDQVTYKIEFTFNSEEKAQVDVDEKEFFSQFAVGENPNFRPIKSKSPTNNITKIKTMKKEPTKEFKEKVEKQKQEIKDLVKKGRDLNNDEDASTLTFPTASGKKTLPLSKLEDDHSSADEDFEVKTVNNNNTTNNNNNYNEKLNLLEEKREALKKKKVELEDLNDRIEVIEKNIEKNINEKKENREDLDAINLLVNTIHLLSYQIMSQLDNQNMDDEQQPLLDNLSKNFSGGIVDMLVDKLKDIKKVMTSCISLSKKRSAPSINYDKLKQSEISNFKTKGIERYATELQLELDQLRLELERRKIKDQSISVSPEQKDDLIRSLREQLISKDKELSDIRAQLITFSSSNYSSEAAKNKIQSLVTNLMRELEESKKKNIEFEQRITKRVYEWQQLNEEKQRLQYKISELQETIHRQMTDLHVILLQNEQKVNLWKSKVLEFAADNNEIRRRASSFLIACIDERDKVENDLLLKYEEMKRNVHFVQLENSDLKLEINHLKDVLQYTDTHNTKELVRSLKDKVYQLETECSVDRITDLQNTISYLNTKFTESENIRRLYKKEILKYKQKLKQKFDEKDCIGYLEKQLEIHEKNLETYKRRYEREPMHSNNNYPLLRRSLNSNEDDTLSQLSLLTLNNTKELNNTFPTTKVENINNYNEELQTNANQHEENPTK